MICIIAGPRNGAQAIIHNLWPYSFPPQYYRATTPPRLGLGRPLHMLLKPARGDDAMRLEIPGEADAERRDEVMGEVRANREAYAARFGYDVRAILTRARERARECDRGGIEREPRRADVSGS